jgi:hypothetical protein
MMNENTLLYGLLFFLLAMLLVIIIYMASAEVNMVEQCREHYNASTKICNGGLT